MNDSAHAPGTPSAPRVTVVVLTRNHVRQTIDTVARLTALPEHPDVIVADNGSTDSTVSLLGSLFPQVRIVQSLGDHGMAGFNRAVLLARTEFVACCEDSTWFAPGALAMIKLYPFTALSANRSLLAIAFVGLLCAKPSAIQLPGLLLKVTVPDRR